VSNKQTDRRSAYCSIPTNQYFIIIFSLSAKQNELFKELYPLYSNKVKTQTTGSIVQTLVGFVQSFLFLFFSQLQLQQLLPKIYTFFKRFIFLGEKIDSASLHCNNNSREYLMTLTF
jgi:hypothetical protein